MASNQTFTLNIKALFDASDVKTKVGDIQKAFNGLRLNDALKNSLQSSFTNLEKALNDFETRAEKGVKTKGDASGLTRSMENVVKEFTKLGNVVDKIKAEIGEGADLSKIIKLDDKTLEQLRNLQKEIDDIQKKLSSVNASKLEEIKKSLSAIKSGSGAEKQGKAALKLFEEGDAQEAINTLTKIIEKLTQLKDKADAVDKDTSVVGNSIDRLKEMKSAMEDAQKQSAGLITEQNQKAAQSAEILARAQQEVVTEVNNGATAVKTYGDNARNAQQPVNDLAQSQARLNTELDSVKSRIQYLLGLNNVINLIKRSIHSAVETVKELDAAMTETAVVTNMTVSDMWSKLPEYTKRANELGVTTVEAYRAATLYYQQGLNDQQAAELSVETLRMARIAGLDAAEATDRMTNALRGFNMELDKVNAQRVDDVYSQLAAMSASNVDEISTAMTKVASLAHNANMDFETTAAFLAQIIETTRESAETAGTALKTVVARFSEVKKLVSEEQLKGQDEEGQLIDVNKVSQALRTASIDLNKYFTGEVGLDDIFMELASKWDSLTSVQQRYIATQAAGSRQQSRFIALMQDYARTQELVAAAYSAEGASAKQFAKTQDSLQSKLARLKNAWDEFLMGVTNNAVIKGAVDVLTFLLNIVNKLTGAFGDGVGSVLKFSAALATIGGLRAAFNSGKLTAFLGSLGNTWLGTKLGYGGNIVAQAGNAAAAPAIQGALIPGMGKTLTSGLAKMGAAISHKELAVDSLASLAPGVISKMGAIAVALGTITTAIGIAYGAYQLWLHNSPEGKLKLAKKEAEKLNEESEKLSNQLKSVQSLQDTYKEKTEEVKNATSIEDRKKAIQDRSDAITEALKKDSTLAQYVITESVDNEIVLKVDEISLQNALESISKKAKEAESAAKFGGANVNAHEISALENQIDSKIQMGNIAKGRELDYKNLSLEEKVEIAVQDARESNDLQSVAYIYDIYKQIIDAQASLKQNAEQGYILQLQQSDISDDLINLLLPILSNAFKKTKKQLTSEELSSLAGLGGTSPILEVLAETYEGTNKDFLDAIQNLTDDQKNTIAKLLDISSDDIGDTLSSYYKTLQENQQLLRKETINKLIRSGIKNTSLLDKVQNKLTISQAKKLDEYADQFSSYGEDFREKLLTQATIFMDQGTFKSSGLEDFFSNITDNPVLTLQAINQAIEKGTPYIQYYAKQLKAIGDAQFSTENQLQYFLISGEYENLNEQISKFIEENGKINSDNVEELAKSSKTLSAMLDMDTMSANGLAKAMTALEAGNIAVTDLNENIIELYNSYDTLSDSVTHAGWIIKNFTPGEDYGDSIDFVNDAIEKMSEMIEGREFNNPNLKSYAELFFGEGFQSWDVTQWEKNFENLKKTAGRGGLDFWTDILGWGSETVEGGIDLQIPIGEYAAALEDGTVKSFRDFVKQELGEGYNFSDDFIDLMIRNAAKQGGEGYKDVAALELNKIMEAYGSVMPSKTDVLAVADAYGFTPQEILDAWTGEAGKLNFSELEDKIRRSYTDISRLSDAAFSAALERGTTTGEAISGRTNTNWILKQLGIDPSTGVFSIDKFKLQIKEVVPEVADGSVTVEEWFKEQVEKQEGGAIKLPVEFTTVKKIDGEWQTEEHKVEIEVKSLEEYQAVSQQIIDAAQQQNVFESYADYANDLYNTLTKISEIDGVKGLESSLQTAEDKANEIKEALSTIDTTLNVNAPSGITIASDAGAAITLKINVAAKGGIVSAANGTIEPGLALTGEEAPEIIWNKEKGYAYLAGKNGPEINNLQPGDQVFNGEQTRKILKRSGISSFAKGTIHSYSKTFEYSIPEKTTQLWGPPASSKTSGGGGDSRKDTSDDWKDKLDWLYNLMEDIAELERVQTQLSDKHERYLEDISKTGRDLYNITNEQLNNLYTQRDNYQEALTRRLQEMREQISESEFTDYVWWNNKDQTIEIDWDKINTITDKDQFDKVSDLVSKAEKIQDQIDDAQEALWDIEGKITELEKRYLDEFIELQKRVYEAVVHSYQEQIDTLSSLDETINEGNDKILDSIQKEIELQRQIRNNTDTENEINEKEARLAYLRRDTTGANEGEIRALEKEIQEARKSYTDTLVDQAIDRLQESNKKASEERQKQIDLLTEQLDYWKETGALWPEVARILEEGINGEGSLVKGSTLEKILQQADNWKAMSDEQKQVWGNELITSVNQAGAYLIRIADGLDKLSVGVWALIPESSIPGNITGHAKGGLNTTTGLAWLDGTVSEPEYVLNARQTDAFLRLADVLPSMFSGNTGNTANIGGNIYVELNMNVGEISSDYDVDRLVERVKEDIYDASSYRNVNAVSFSR